MARLHHSTVSLRIFGDDLIPEEISRLLGASPTRSQTKGDKIVGKNTGHVRIAKTGMWLLCAGRREPEDMDGQIHEILDQLTTDLTIWQSVKKKYHIDLFCGLFMDGENEGLMISSQSLSALGERGIEMGLDIYGGSEDDEETGSQSGAIS